MTLLLPTHLERTPAGDYLKVYADGRVLGMTEHERPDPTLPIISTDRDPLLDQQVEIELRSQRVRQLAKQRLDQERTTGAGPTLRDHLLSRSQLADLPQPEPLIDDTLDQRTVALLAGRNSTGKSFLALDWACCIATGKSWQGRGVQTPGRVLYIAAEGAHGLHQRVSAWEYAWQSKVDDLDVLPVPVNLFSGAGFPELREIATDNDYRLVVVDTWARSTLGGKENDNSDSTLAFDRLDRLRRTGSTVLVVAHTDAGDTKARGATALEDNADTVYRLKGDAGYLELTRTKRKDGPAEDRHQLQLQPILDSCVLQNTRLSGVDTAGRTRDVLSLFVSTFGDLGASKAEWRTACVEAGIKSSGVFYRAVSDLRGRGAVINTGTDKQPFYKIGETTDV